jgi:glycosyltransferase involved in cell wall biosynthesis
MRLIYLSPVPWSSFSQRSHETVRFFHSQCEGEVLWVNPYPTRFPVLSDIRNGMKKPIDLPQKTPDWLRVATPGFLPIEPIPFSWILNHLFWKEVVSTIHRFSNNSTILGIGKPSLLAIQLLSEGIGKKSFYDAMDGFPEFYKGFSRLAMSQRERRVLQKVSTVVTSSTALWNRLKPIGKDVRLILNACATERLPEPVIHPNDKTGRRIVLGYVGTMAYWFDWTLLTAMAKAVPEAEFRLIGPVYTQPPPILPGNVHIEHPLSHEKAMEAMNKFDVGLIPFKSVPLTSFVDPIKYYEYRSMGLPVISSSFGEMMLRKESDGVYKVDRGSDMKAMIERSLTMGKDLENIMQFRKNNSWESRFSKGNMFDL